MEKDILLSEELRNRFGTIKINIIEQNDDYRITVLESDEGNAKSLAICMFSETPFSTELEKVHEKIKKGGLIGETIKSNGFSVVKNLCCNFSIDAPKIFNT